MFRYYLKLGTLSIRANPVLSGLMVAAIAIGIGACMTIMTVRHVMSGNPIEHRNDQLYHVQVDNWNPDDPYEEPNNAPEQVTYLDARALFGADRAFRQTTSFKTSRVVQPDGDDARPFQVRARATTADFFPMFDVPFLYGSGWDDSSDLAEERVIVIDRALNEQLFGGEDPVGETLRLNDETYRITGVLDTWNPVPKFYDVNNNPFEDPAQLFLPFSLAIAKNFDNTGNTNCWKPIPDGTGREGFLSSECVWIQMWVELQNDAAKQDYLNFLDAYVEEQKLLGRFPRPLNNHLRNPAEWMEYNEVVDSEVDVLLSLAVLFLIVCLLNTVGLLLAKAMRRAKDTSLRRALGASKSELFRQHVIEAGMIGVAGGLLGIVTTWFGLRGIENLFIEYDFIQHLVRMDWTMVTLAVALSIVSALGAALYPTWRTCNITPATHLRLQ
ncbi:MAG: ABC transporter permease [Woeseiaceae bacterium]|nr:ABC transporter permease [Woeseiaceae bacterium]